MGISGGMDIYGINFESLKLLQANDPWLQAQNANTWLPDFNVGMLLYSDENGDRYVYSSTSDKPNFYVGLSIQHILSVITTNAIAKNDSYLLKHYNFIAGYKYPFNDVFAAEGNVLLKYVADVPFEADITARLFYKNNYWLGLSYRTDGDLIFKIGMYISDKILFGYSFDFATSQIQNKTAHEIVLGYRFSEKKFIPKY